MSKEFKVYFSPIGSRDPFNEVDKSLGSAISVFREVKPNAAIFLFSKEMEKKQKVFYKILDGAIKELQESDKDYHCEVIKPDDTEHKDLIETEDLCVNYDECFKKYIPVINHYYEEYDSKMDKFIINVSSGQPQQKIVYLMFGFMEGRKKIEPCQAEHNPGSSGFKKKCSPQTCSYRIEEQTIDNYDKLNRLFTTRKLIDQYCFVSAKNLWSEQEEPGLFSKLKYIVELLDSVNGKDIKGLLEKREEFSKALGKDKISGDRKMFNCYAYLMSCELYLKRKDYRAMIASFSPICEMPDKNHGFEKNTQCLFYTLLGACFKEYVFDSLVSPVKLLSLKKIADSDRDILLEYILLNRLVASKRNDRFYDNLRNGIVAHKGYQQIDDAIISSYIDFEIKQMVREAGDSLLFSNLFDGKRHDAAFIFSLAWDIFEYVARKRKETYPRLDILKQEIIDTLELSGGNK